MTHRLICSSQRNSKRYIAVALAEMYAMRGEHVHFHPETCYNGDAGCEKFVRKRLEWKGDRFEMVG